MIREDGTSTISVTQDGDRRSVVDSDSGIRVIVNRAQVVVQLGNRCGMEFPAELLGSLHDVLGYAMGPMTANA